MRPSSRGKPEVSFRTDLPQDVVPDPSPPVRFRASPLARGLGVAMLLVGCAVVPHFVSVWNRFSPLDELFVPSLRTSLVSSEKGRGISQVLADVWTDRASNPRWAPLTYTSFVIEFRLFAARPGGHHAVSILWHAINTLLVWTLLSRLGIRGAALASAVFAVHPLTVDAVSWIAQRPVLQSAALSLASLIVLLRWTGLNAVPEGYAFIRLPRSNAILYTMALALLALAAMSGPMGLCVVPAIWTILWWRRGTVGVHNLVALFPMMLIAVTAASLDIASQRAFLLTDFDAPRWFDSLLLSGRAIVAAMIGGLVPIELSFSYPDWSLSAPAIGCLLSIAAVMVMVTSLFIAPKGLARTGTLATFVLVICALIPAIMGVDVLRFRVTQIADHAAYLAIIPIIALIVASIVTWKSQAKLSPVMGKLLSVALPAGVLALLSVLTFMHARTYRDAATMWVHAQTQYPGTIKPHLQLAELYLLGGLGIAPDTDQAERHALAALNIDRDHPRALATLGRVHAHRRDFDKAIAQYVLALARRPDDVQTRILYAVALERSGQPDAAIAQYETVLSMHADQVTALNNLGNLYSTLGNLSRAEECFRRAIRAQPRFVPPYINLSTILDRQGRLTDAVAELQKVIFDIDRSNLDAWMQAALLANKAGDLVSAERFARQAVSLRPELAEPLNLLGIICLRRGKYDESALYFRFAIERDPQSPMYRQNLETALRAKRAPAGNGN
jgi:tetratricopeptide (TPR) repeat protein